MESYEKIKEIGKGSYGVVWLVSHKKDRKNVCLLTCMVLKTNFLKFFFPVCVETNRFEKNL